MHEWYDVRVRGVLGSGKRDVHEIEMLGRNLTWTEEGLEYEGSDKHRRALLEGLGLNEESKAVNSAAVKLEEIGQEEDTEVLDASEAKRFRSLAATLNYMSSDRSDVQYAAKEVCKMMAKPTHGSWKRLKKAGRYLTGVEKVTWVMRSWRHDDKDKRRHDDDQRYSDACAEYGGSRVLRSRHGCSGGTWNAVDDGRLGRDHPRANLD